MKWIALCAGFLLVGCAKTPSLVGTWTSGLGGALTTYHFRQDGTFLFDNLYAGSHASAEGTYKVEGGMLYFNPTKTSVEGVGPEAERIRSSIAQPSRTMIKMMPGTDGVFQLGSQTPPLMVHRMSTTP